MTREEVAAYTAKFDATTYADPELTRQLHGYLSNMIGVDFRADALMPLVLELDGKRVLGLGLPARDGSDIKVIAIIPHADWTFKTDLTDIPLVRADPSPNLEPAPVASGPKSIDHDLGTWA